MTLLIFWDIFKVVDSKSLNQPSKFSTFSRAKKADWYTALNTKACLDRKSILFSSNQRNKIFGYMKSSKLNEVNHLIFQLEFPVYLYAVCLSSWGGRRWVGDHIFRGMGMGLYRRLYAWAAEGRSKRKAGRNRGWVSIKDHESQQLWGWWDVWIYLLDADGG